MQNWLFPPVTNYNAVNSLGLKGATVNALFPNITTAVSTVTGGMTTLGPQSGFLTSLSSDQIPIVSQASATWVKGNHTLKFGWGYRLEYQVSYWAT